MGASLDWSREEFTLSEKLSRAVRKAFSNLYQQGKIYEGSRIVNRSVGTQSVVSDSEVIHKEEEGNLYYIKYFIQGKGDSITIATTRPETIFADVAVAVSPHDKRYKKIVGKNVLIPIINKPIPVITDEAVDMTFGTGALKITPTHDPVDYEIGMRSNLPMDRFAIDKKGYFTDLAGETYAKRKIEDVYENIITELEEIGNLEKIEKHTHNIPYCERSNTRIQPLLSRQWFVDVKEPAEKVLSALDNKEVTVYPERFVHDFHNWLDNVQPWCISRQLWWGHRIPVWKDIEGNNYIFDEDVVIDYLKKNKQKKNILLTLIIFNLVADSRLGDTFNVEQLIDVLTSKSIVEQRGSVLDTFLAMYELKGAGDKTWEAELEELKAMFDGDAKNIEKVVDALADMPLIVENKDEYSFDFGALSGKKDTILKQEEDVLDTWFSSSLWPFSTLGWPEQTQDLENYYPNNLLETANDILFPRVARMMMMAEINMGNMPFDTVYFHGIVNDEKGRKMSKSLGNVMDPLTVIEKFGADALRCSLIIGSTPGNTVNYSDQKADYYYRFANKLWNAVRFVHTNIFKEGDDDVSLDLDAIKGDLEKNMEELNHFDKWLLGKINMLIEESERMFSDYHLGQFGESIVGMVWGDFCDRYIEISKREKSDYTDKVLLYAIGTMLKMLHPYMPFVTERLWEHMHFDSMLCTALWPTEMQGVPKDFKISILMDMITEWRNLRAQQKVKPHENADIAIQATVSFNNFVKSYEDLVKDLVKTENIIYLGEEEAMPEDYQTAMVIDMKIGLKSIQVLDKKTMLAQLEKQLSDEESYMQSLRNMIANPSFTSSAPSHVMEEKQKKLDEVKQKITKLKLEIAKLKV